MRTKKATLTAEELLRLSTTGRRYELVKGELFEMPPAGGRHGMAGSLSGGNKQKVIVAREFSRPVKLLIANQPTRGIDVGSIEYIHNQIIEQRDAGSAVLLVSAELDEILSLADRVAVMFDGRIVKTLPISESTRERLGLLMAGSDVE